MIPWRARRTPRRRAGSGSRIANACRGCSAGCEAGWPHPRVDRWDPFALRALLLLLLAIGYIANREDAADRIKAAFILKPTALPSSARLDAWITPPLYTGKPPIMVADGSREKAGRRQAADRSSPCPNMSELTVRVNHSDAAQFSLRFMPREGGAEPLSVETADQLVTASAAKGKENTRRIQGKADHGRPKSSCSTMA